MRSFASFVFVLAVACGGSSKQTVEPPPPAEEPAPAMTSSGAAPAEPGAPPPNPTPVGVFDCTSGVAECDELFSKTVMCVKSASALDDVTRAQYVDAMQNACVQVKEASKSPEAMPQVVKACKDGLAQLQEQKAQMQCSF
jgi:hypothetical protein